jgi:hypothetical protein
VVKSSTFTAVFCFCYRKERPSLLGFFYPPPLYCKIGCFYEEFVFIILVGLNRQSVMA